MKRITLEQIVGLMEKKKYKVFRDNSKPYNLNLVGIRSSDPVPNMFNDELWVFWKNVDEWEINIYPITTDPGLYWLRNPMNTEGTGILKPGNYPGLWKIGIHKTYEALVQHQKCTLIRDYNRDDVIDYNSGREVTGIFGVNLHHAGENSLKVDKWSAACQVFQKKSDFKEFMNFARKARNVWGNSFSYTLLEEEEI